MVGCLQGKTCKCSFTRVNDRLTGCGIFPQQGSCRLWLAELLEKWRPRPESNRRRRLCRPLRNHSATWPSGIDEKRSRSSDGALPIADGMPRHNPQNWLAKMFVMA